MIKGKHIVGKVNIKSELNIIELGKIISKNILGGAVLDGLEKNIYDEVPAIFSETGLLGFGVVLQGYSGMKNDVGFWFELIPNHTENIVEKEIINLSAYLVSLFKARIESQNIIILDEIVC